MKIVGEMVVTVVVLVAALVSKIVEAVFDWLVEDVVWLDEIGIIEVDVTTAVVEVVSVVKLLIVSVLSMIAVCVSIVF